jgi:ribosomal protein S18 acetylase RimI-like enzyme
MATTVALRRPRLDDVDALAELHAWSWRVTYGPLLTDDERKLLTVQERRRLWERVVGAPRPREATWVAESQRRIVGFVLAGPGHDAGASRDAGEVHAIHVAPGLHGRGIGGRLLAAAVEDLRSNAFTRATLWVIGDNHAARRFYERHGWQPDGATKRAAMGDFVGLPIVNEVRYARPLADDAART